MMTRDELKASVAFLLRTIAERRLEGRRPDYVVGFDVTRDSRATLGWERQYDAIMAEREPQASAEYSADVAEYEAAVRDYMREEWNDLKAHGMGRLQRACRSRHLPADLRKWAQRQLALAMKSPNALAVAYAVLVLRDAAEWEAAHEADESLDACVTGSFGDARASGEYDGGPAVDDRPVHTVGESYRYRQVA